MTKQIRKGYGTVILASLAYGVMPVVSKLLLWSGMNSESVVFYRFFLTCLFSALILAAFRRFRAVTLPQAVLLALFGILGFGFTMQFLTISYQYIPIGLATVLHFAYPLFVTLIMLAVYGEKPAPARLWGCAAALAGICLMVDLKGGFSPGGVIYALLSAVTYSAFVVSNTIGMLWQSDSYALTLRVQSVSQSVLRTELYSYRHTAGSLLPIPVGMPDGCQPSVHGLCILYPYDRRTDSGSCESIRHQHAGACNRSGVWRHTI